MINSWKIRKSFKASTNLQLTLEKKANPEAPGMLSRSLVNDHEKEENRTKEIESIIAITNNIGIKDLQISWLEKDTWKDTRYQELHKAIRIRFKHLKINYGRWRNPHKLYALFFPYSIRPELLMALEQPFCRRRFGCIKEPNICVKKCRQKINELHDRHNGENNLRCRKYAPSICRMADIMEFNTNTAIEG